MVDINVILETVLLKGDDMKDYLKDKIKKYEKELKEYKDQFLWSEFGEGRIMGKLEAYENCLKHIELEEPCPDIKK